MSKNINITSLVLLSMVSFILCIVPVYADGDYNHRLGDVNADGSINIIDVVYLFKNRNLDYEDGDINADNSINIIDVVYLFKHYDQMREPIKYAENIKLKYYNENGNEVNPYNGESWSYKIFEDATGQKFLLKNESQPVPTWADGKYDKILTVPLTSVVTMSSTHIALMEPLNDDGSVIGSVKGVMWGGSYTWYFDNIKQGLDNGSIQDVGSSYSPNWENITALNPQAVIVYPGYSGDAIIEKCKSLNITYIANSEYLEGSYLARCEWVKSFAAFYNKEEEAKKYFTKIDKRALNVNRKTYNSDYTVLVAWGKNYPSYGGTYVPKAQAYVTKGIIDNCHADYIFKDIPGTGSSKIDYETFAERAKNADIWVVPSNTNWLSSFKTDHPGYTTFESTKNNRVFCISEDYYQLGLMNTDELLMDLGTIIHPEAFKGRTTHYFLSYNTDTGDATPYTAN
ncbi:ABC-type Fe3+-hydroxamate transport system periplasmic component-like protein [Methanococcus aeolicus Nankai-3]|uniref:ABC-type Fe3+-hydroxamate transport system periplasmic component-like protein n=1 Tax=Methanococcus aeolicus (strain ATCC BAA-1280 / DSM 17508 / OCM 812 / Nankai-3) TaxID=419665 RepID=A6UT88_META3|nr:ABC transporter substrate-binding protein [Methanococcus aeolicus]ABR55710.1 ABC-type Fe3+-hydroxamate transport system periplasmic component-like protein [Methanococcus aeolicus Nankai-3]